MTDAPHTLAQADWIDRWEPDEVYPAQAEGWLICRHIEGAGVADTLVSDKGVAVFTWNPRREQAPAGVQSPPLPEA
jgi:hypothetical protein